MYCRYPFSSLYTLHVVLHVAHVITRLHSFIGLKHTFSQLAHSFEALWHIFIRNLLTNRERSHITEIFYQKSSYYTSFSFMGSCCHPPPFLVFRCTVYFSFLLLRGHIYSRVCVGLLIQNHVWELFTKLEHISGPYMYSVYADKQWNWNFVSILRVVLPIHLSHVYLIVHRFSWLHVQHVVLHVRSLIPYIQITCNVACWVQGSYSNTTITQK